METVAGHARHQLPVGAVADRGGRRRPAGPRPDERQAEAALPAGSAHRFHLRGGGEELGLVGSVGLLLGFLVIFWRGLRAALRMRDDFGRYLALGVTVVVVVQGFINMSVVLGMMPTKGIPLPMISYGGSSLLSTLALLGILMNVSEQRAVDADASRLTHGRDSSRAWLPHGRRRHGRARDSGAGGGAGTAAARARRLLRRNRARAWKPSWSRPGFELKTIEIGGLNRVGLAAEAGDAWRGCRSPPGLPQAAARRLRRLQHGRLCRRAAGDGGAAAARAGGGDGAERRSRDSPTAHRPVCGAGAGLVSGDRALLSRGADRNHRAAGARGVLPRCRPSRAAARSTC